MQWRLRAWASAGGAHGECPCTGLPVNVQPTLHYMLSARSCTTHLTSSPKKYRLIMFEIENQWTILRNDLGNDINIDKWYWCSRFMTPPRTPPRTPPPFNFSHKNGSLNWLFKKGKVNGNWAMFISLVLNQSTHVKPLLLQVPRDVLNKWLKDHNFHFIDFISYSIYNFFF